MSSTPRFFRPLRTVAQNLVLSFSQPHSQDVFSAIQVDSNGNIHRFLHDLPFAADMIVDGIQKYHGIDGFQGPLLPLFCDGQNLICDSADCTGQDGNDVDVLNVSFNIAGGHTLSVHGQDFLLNVLADTGLVLFQHLGLKFPLPDSGN